MSKQTYEVRATKRLDVIIDNDALVDLLKSIRKSEILNGSDYILDDKNKYSYDYRPHGDSNDGPATQTEIELYEAFNKVINYLDNKDRTKELYEKVKSERDGLTFNESVILDAGARYKSGTILREEVNKQNG